MKNATLFYLFQIYCISDGDDIYVKRRRQNYYHKPYAFDGVKMPKRMYVLG